MRTQRDKGRLKDNKRQRDRAREKWPDREITCVGLFAILHNSRVALGHIDIVEVALRGKKVGNHRSKCIFQSLIMAMYCRITRTNLP